MSLSKIRYFLTQNKKATGDSIDAVFGIIIEDLELENEDGTVTKAYIKLSYDVYAEISGREVSDLRYYKINSILNVDLDEDNPEYIEVNGGTESFNVNINVDQSGSKNYYNVLGRSNVTIIINYEIIYETTN